VRVLTVGNLFPPHDQGGGYELVWAAAVDALRGRGHVVRVLTTEHRVDGRPEDVADVHRQLRWYWRDHAFPRLPTREVIRVERHNASVLRDHLADLRPDVVAWWSMGGLSLSLLERVRRARIPAVAFVHDDWLDYGRALDQWHRRWRARPRAAWVAERLTGAPARVRFAEAAHMAFVSRATRDHAWFRSVPLGTTSIAHSGIEARFLDAAPPRDWSWSLLYVGRIDRRKGIGTAIDALARLPEAASLTVVGDGPQPEVERLRRLARDLGLGDRVRWLGARPRRDLPGLYAQADAVVFPVEWQEPWGLVPLEAMGRGRPVVATGRGGSAEYLRDGGNCLVFRAGDPDHLARQVRRLADDPQLRDGLRERGAATARAHAQERFHADVERTLGDRIAGRRAIRPAAGGPPRDRERHSISVILPARGGVRLERRLEALARRPHQGLEVLVTGTGRVPGTWPLEVRGVGPGVDDPAACRAVGLAAARGDLVLHLGGDAVAAPGLVEAHLRAHEGCGQAGCVVAGVTRTARGRSPFAHWYARMRHREAGERPQGGAPPPDLAGDNLSVRRDVLESVGGFDTGQIPPCLSDLDLAYRLFDAGVLARYATDARATRHPVIGADEGHRAAAAAARADLAFTELRPHLEPVFRGHVIAAAAAPPARGRAARLLRWVPRGLPWVGPRAWDAATRYHLQRLAPSYLSTYEQASATPGATR
jgi:glycogen synthase